MRLKRLLLSVTSSCNLRCGYCYIFSLKEPPTPLTMTADTIRRVIERIYRLYHGGVEFVQFFGGEPALALPQIAMAIEECERLSRGYGLIPPRYGMVTSLSLLDRAICRLLKERAVELTVSLDGPKPIHNTLRRLQSNSGSYSQVTANIERLKAESIAFNIECTFTALHIEQGYTVAELIEFFRRIGAKRSDVVCVMAPASSRYYLYGRHLSTLTEQFTDAVDYWFAHCMRDGQMAFGLGAETLSLRRSSSCGFCPAGSAYLAVSPEGVFYPCHLFIGDKRFVLGTAKEDGPLKAFQPTTHHCNGCPIKRLCLSCAGRNLFYTGSIDGIFMEDCRLKMAVTGRVIENLERLLVRSQP